MSAPEFELLKNGRPARRSPRNIERALAAIGAEFGTVGRDPVVRVRDPESLRKTNNFLVCDLAEAPDAGDGWRYIRGRGDGYIPLLGELRLTVYFLFDLQPSMGLFRRVVTDLTRRNPVDA